MLISVTRNYQFRRTSWSLKKGHLCRQNPCSPQCFCNLSKSFFVSLFLAYWWNIIFFLFARGHSCQTCGWPLMAWLCKFVIVISYILYRISTGGGKLIPKGGCEATMYKYDTRRCRWVRHWLQLKGVRNPWQARGCDLAVTLSNRCQRDAGTAILMHPRCFLCTGRPMNSVMKVLLYKFS